MLFISYNPIIKLIEFYQDFLKIIKSIVNQYIETIKQYYAYYINEYPFYLNTYT